MPLIVSANPTIKANIQIWIQFNFPNCKSFFYRRFIHYDPPLAVVSSLSRLIYHTNVSASTSSSMRLLPLSLHCRFCWISAAVFVSLSPYYHRRRFPLVSSQPVPSHRPYRISSYSFRSSQLLASTRPHCIRRNRCTAAMALSRARCISWSTVPNSA